MWQDPSENILSVIQMKGAEIKEIYSLRTLNGFTLGYPTFQKPKWVLKYREYNLDKPESERKKIQKSIVLE